MRLNLLQSKRLLTVRIMSSRHALYGLGYPYDTMVVTKRSLNLYFG